MTRLFRDSSIVKILDLVQNAAARKARTEKLITTFARYYTPAVVLAAAMIALVPPLALGADFRTWIYRALVLLVISCPCALVVSVPLGYFGGIGRASRRGILVKGSNFLDALAHVRTVVFDKTGTLTQGVFEVREGGDRQRPQPRSSCWLSRLPRKCTPTILSVPPSCGPLKQPAASWMPTVSRIMR